ncbi:MAG: efflux RND transporter periplasmic adaptor subunit [Candidatus Azobacteroides sp.]|nr:efflux RND transporter periplasmic adaptor subunit [Candidatus Azobacteroides sp.]
MKYKMIFVFRLLPFAFCLFLSCHSKSTDKEDEEQETTTPVTVTHCAIGDIQEIVELNATSVFLQKNQIKATTNGYIKSVEVVHGQRVSKGQALFVLKAKEAEVLGSTINDLDTNNHFTGEMKIVANSNGFISAINYQTGDYVMEGDVLAEINDAGSLVFLMQLPYELSPYLSKNRTLKLELPNGKILTGTVSLSMPTVDPVSQTQSIVIRIPNDGSIPENLIAKVKIIKSIKKNAIALPKAAILTDETQENFWIMKMIDEEQAAKVPVRIGVESNGQVEILSPKLSPDDVILETGNYGLPDTAKVVIEK